MANWGGTDAESIKKAVDNIYCENGRLPLKDFNTKLVSSTADGASVNFGRLSGFLTRLDAERGWLLKIHCSNHRIELAVKSAFKDSEFSKIDTFYESIFNILKHSGKIKSQIKAAPEAMNIQHYSLPKLTGTRFIGHRINALKKLLDMWPVFITGLSNTLAGS